MPGGQPYIVFSETPVSCSTLADNEFVKLIAQLTLNNIGPHLQSASVGPQIPRQQPTTFSESRGDLSIHGEVAMR